MSFFGSLFGELIPGGDCSNIEQDPHADPFDKEVCQQFRRFNDAFGRSFDIEHRPPEEESDGGSKPDAQSLRDAILNKSDDGGRETPHRWRSGRRPVRPRVDEDLDESVRRDPGLLDDYLREEPNSPSERPTQQNPHFHSSYSSVVITTRPDGSYEERRTVRDSDGNEKVTVTYSDGSQTEGRQSKQTRIWDWLGYK